MVLAELYYLMRKYNSTVALTGESVAMKDFKKDALTQFGCSVYSKKAFATQVNQEFIDDWMEVIIGESNLYDMHGD